MGRPFDAGQDFAGIVRDHDQAIVDGRLIYGIFQDETADGDPRGGPVFVTPAINIFDETISREVLQQTTITIRGTDYHIDGRDPDGRGGAVRLLLTPA